MSKYIDRFASHFIAINYHGFHNVNAALDCVHSVLRSAKGLNGQVAITFFHHCDRPASPKLASQLKNLDVPLACFPESSNGEALNLQLNQVEEYDFFYRVDADDLVSLGRFQWQSEWFSKTDCDICGGGLIYRNTSTEAEYPVTPSQHPGVLDYLFNRYFLHPTLAFRFSSFSRVSLRYGKQRLEDKGLALSAYKAGLTVQNDRRIYGTYNLDPNARSGRLLARRDHSYNLAFIRASHSFWALPIAYALFAASLLIGREQLRQIRKALIRLSP